MSERQPDGEDELDRIVAELKAKGWIEQNWGMIYINGTLATNLLKGGQVLRLGLELYPDEEFLDEGWPEEDQKAEDRVG